MIKEVVILVFDIGRTNKKYFLINELYQIVETVSAHLEETVDEDGFPCEDIQLISDWVLDSLEAVLQREEYDIKAINFSAHGASFVHIDIAGKVVTPLYNYLNLFPENITEQFYHQYGYRDQIALETASPVLGNLNSGMQLYRLKYTKPELFSRIDCSLHLPQYISYLITGKAVTDITSIGCHTQLWNFEKNDYHHWVINEGADKKFPAIISSEIVFRSKEKYHFIPTGIGLHDSSAALIPYLLNYKEPFVLISTGTWSISLNPFNHQSLTIDELKKDCLCYLNYQGKPVKASRLFAGHEYDLQLKRIANHFNKSITDYGYIDYDYSIIQSLKEKDVLTNDYTEEMFQQCLFSKRELNSFANDAEAYHQLMADIVLQQFYSTNLVVKGTPIQTIFVDGGFSKNTIYMQLLAALFPSFKVYASSVSQASSIGAALVIHDAWNTKAVPSGIIQMGLIK